MLLLIQIGGGVQHNLLVGTLLFGWQQVGQEDQGEDHHQHVGQGKTEHHHYQGEDEGEEVGGTEVCVPPEPELHALEAVALHLAHLHLEEAGKV